MKDPKSFCVYKKIKGRMEKVPKTCGGDRYYHKYHFMAAALMDACQLLEPDTHFWINATMKEPD